MTHNNFNNNGFGISLEKCSFNKIINNEISNTNCSFKIRNSKNNNISNNNMTNNNLGISLKFFSRNNTIYHNNFIDNTENAFDECINSWDDGKYGNFWSDYEEKYPNAKKKRKEGIWDTPYDIPGGLNKDNRPLIKPWPKTFQYFNDGQKIESDNEVKKITKSMSESVPEDNVIKKNFIKLLG